MAYPATTSATCSGGERCSSEPIARSSGQILATAATVASVMQPPSTTDGTRPSHWAATPDSNSPISLLVPMKMMLTAETRPRIESGVSSCNTVERMTTEMLSAAPRANRQKSDNENDFE